MRHFVAAAALAAAVVAVPAASHADSAGAGPYTLELLDARGSLLPTYVHDGRTYVLGKIGSRYSIRFHNGSGRRVEVVASVDGRDVIDGRPADWSKNGYVIPPGGDVVIDGFRLSHEEVAAFRFSRVSRSYASLMGSARDVGVIGAAVFPEQAIRPPCDIARGSAEPLDTFGAGDVPNENAPAPAARPQTRSLDSFDAPAPAPTRSLASETPESAQATRARRESRPGLGTEFGERRISEVEEVSFQRAGSRPAAVLSLRYNDRAGLLALGIGLDEDDLGLRESAEPFRRNVVFSRPPRGWNE